jgi:branched-chain amino acid transport system permease protein
MVEINTSTATPARRKGVLLEALPIITILLALAAVPLIAKAIGEPFIIKVFTRVIVFSMLAMALNLVLGFGGLVSLLHAGLFGVGGYVVGIAAFHDFNAETVMLGPLAFSGTSNLAITLPLAALASGLVALVTGAISLRTSGAYFIMITLAFNQMLYYAGVALQHYGGEDGLQIMSSLHFAGIDISERTRFYYVCLGALLITFVIVSKLVNSRFGMVLRASAQNERRVIAIGVAPTPYRLVAFVISGMIAGVAGALLASGQQFISPADMSWGRSGDLVVMCVLGGIGTVWGPIAGATVFLILELVLSSWTHYWQLPFGLFVIAVVVLFHGGLSDLWSLALGRPAQEARHD